MGKNFMGKLLSCFLLFIYLFFLSGTTSIGKEHSTFDLDKTESIFVATPRYGDKEDFRFFDADFRQIPWDVLKKELSSYYMIFYDDQGSFFRVPFEGIEELKKNGITVDTSRLSGGKELTKKNFRALFVKSDKIYSRGFESRLKELCEPKKEYKSKERISLVEMKKKDTLTMSPYISVIYESKIYKVSLSSISDFFLALYQVYGDPRYDLK